MIRSLPVALLSVVLLAGCSTSVADINVTGGATPRINGLEKFSVDKTTSRVLKKGSGDAIVLGDTVELNYLAVNGRTGKNFDSSFASGHPIALTLGAQMLKGFTRGLIGKVVGSRVLVAIPPKDGFNRAMDAYGLQKDDTMVFVFDVLAIEPKQASGKAQKVPASVPQLQLKDGTPSAFTKSAATAATPTEGIYVSIAGTGAKVATGQAVSVQYLGQEYPAGKVFDTSWNKQAVSVVVGTGGKPKCWDQLIGQRIGSRVILVCPANTAYGKAGNMPTVKPNQSLIFAVDILGAL